MRKFKSLPVELTDNEMDQSEDALDMSIRDIRHRINSRVTTSERRAYTTIYSLRANEVIRLFNIMGWKCIYCGIPLKLERDDPTKTAPPDMLVVEHLTALRSGGLNAINNIGCACNYCNTKKANISLSTFLRSINKDEVDFRKQLKDWLDQHNSMQEY